MTASFPATDAGVGVVASETGRVPAAISAAACGIADASALLEPARSRISRNPGRARPGKRRRL